MLGIAIVVILISIGILFIVSNALRGGGEATEKREFSEKQLATNILASMLSTSTPCQNDRISTLLIDCGNCYQTGSCRSCDGVDVCTYLNDTIALLLDATLKNWNKKYELKAYTDPTLVPVHITNNIDECLSGEGEGFRYIQKDSYYLPLYPGTMTVELGLCS